MVDPMEELEYEEGGDMDDDADDPENNDLAEKKVDWNRKQAKMNVQNGTIRWYDTTFGLKK